MGPLLSFSDLLNAQPGVLVASSLAEVTDTWAEFRTWAAGVVALLFEEGVKGGALGTVLTNVRAVVSPGVCRAWGLRVWLEEPNTPLSTLILSADVKSNSEASLVLNITLVEPLVSLWTVSLVKNTFSLCLPSSTMMGSRVGRVVLISWFLGNEFSLCLLVAVL